MTSTLCRSAALVLIIALWLTKLAKFFGMVVKAIVTFVETVIATLQESAKTGPQLLAFWYGCLGRSILRRLASFVAAIGAGPGGGKEAHGSGVPKTEGTGLVVNVSPRKICFT